MSAAMGGVSDNAPDLWRHLFPRPSQDDHKYSRGTLLIRGGAEMTGATRLSARAAQRIGAGLVTLAAPLSAQPIYAESLESVIVKKCDTLGEYKEMIGDKHEPALLIGPGLGIDEMMKEEVLAALEAKRPTVLDADALSNFEEDAQTLFGKTHDACVMTPHEGEFARIFGHWHGDKKLRALNAAREAECVILLKGFETVIASPGGELVVNRDAPPWLATGGSGDVLAGMIAGLIAQKMPVFEAACAAAWLHARIADNHGPGLIAEDLVDGIPHVLQELMG